MSARGSWAVVALAGALAAGRAGAAGMPVFDASTFGQMTLSVQTLGDQLNQLQAAYAAVSGTRNLGEILYDPALREALPSDWAHVYDGAMAGGYAGISGSLRSIQAAERLPDSTTAAQAGIAARSRSAAATDKAVGLRAYDGARARLSQIEQLMRRINTTKDPKGIQELHARLAVEQAAVQNEATKLQLVAMLQRAEEKLVEQQKSDLAQRILGASNRGMPACCSASLTPGR
ncbi:P-type DNA transfer protein VirB5 [Anaeromyxobacter paludicola]|nr:P-type DNA transfer protein VirB5 [Anaeromyxobacter paludicola]